MEYDSIVEVARALRSGETSPVELTNHMLARIERIDPRLRSYRLVTRDAALGQAQTAGRELRQGRDRGPLHGVPIAVKDLCYTRGIATAGGLPFLADWVPDYDATVVTRLREAGAVLLGKLNMTEGAGLEHHPDMPRPSNPWGADLWTGVSSSGSGVATAAGLCFGSLGSDTGGSIRFPSSANNITGLKPTWGGVSRHGVMPCSPTRDVIGPMARSVVDVAILYDAVCGPDDNDSATLSAPGPGHVAALGGTDAARGVRVGVDWDFIGRDVEAAVFDAVSAAIRTLGRLGADIRAITFADPAGRLPHGRVASDVEIAASHETMFAAHADRYGRWLRSAVERGLAADPVAVGRGIIERADYRVRFNRMFDDVDMVVLPVLAQRTPRWEEIDALAAPGAQTIGRFTGMVNTAGNPALTLPCGFVDDCVPIGFQLVGPHWSEAELLRVGHAFQQAVDWHARRPPCG